MIKNVGKLDGETILEATLESANQRVAILNYGCIVRRWQVFDPSLKDDQHTRDLVLGFNSVAGYTAGARHFGTVAGRVANRTKRGQFSLDNATFQLSTNNGAHHLHGGRRGLGQRIWSMEADSGAQQVRLTYLSPDGEEGYPGEVAFEVTFRLSPSGLRCAMRGTPDTTTPINLAQHNYYNLDGRGDVLGHTLNVEADHYLPVDEELIPLGTVASVASTRFEFRGRQSLSATDPQRLGVDHNLVLRPERDQSAPAATLISSDGEISLEVTTDQPGIQVYTAAALSTPERGIEGRKYGPFAGICLEAQGFPDALNKPDFPSIICTPDNPYQQTLNLHVSVNV